MALTILTAPSDTSSVSNEMLFIIQEPTKSVDPVTYPNYKYVLDIYVDSALVARLKATPDPTYKFGKFDVSVILRDYVPVYGLKANYASQTETYNPILNYTVKLGEEYSDTLYTNLVTDTQRSCFKSYKAAPYTTTDAISNVSGEVFSNIPRGSSVNLTDYKDAKWLIIPFFSNVTGIAISYNFDDGAGNIIGSGGSVNYTTANEILQINLGFVKAAALMSLTQSEQEQVRRMVFDVDDGLTTISYTIVYQCSKHPLITLAWLNPYGAYESYTFGLVNKKTNEIARKEFARLPYEINASGVVSYDSNGVLYGSKRGYNSSVKTTLSITSHLLTDAEYVWLADMLNSPDVYIFNSDLDRFVPVVITDSNYEYRTYMNSRLTPLQFTVQYSDDYNTQFL